MWVGRAGEMGRARAPGGGGSRVCVCVEGANTDSQRGQPFAVADQAPREKEKHARHRAGKARVRARERRTHGIFGGGGPWEVCVWMEADAPLTVADDESPSATSSTAYRRVAHGLLAAPHPAVSSPAGGGATCTRTAAGGLGVLDAEVVGEGLGTGDGEGDVEWDGDSQADADSLTTACTMAGGSATESGAGVTAVTCTLPPSMSRAAAIARATASSWAGVGPAP